VSEPRIPNTKAVNRIATIVGLVCLWYGVASGVVNGLTITLFYGGIALLLWSGARRRRAKSARKLKGDPPESST